MTLIGGALGDYEVEGEMTMIVARFIEAAALSVLIIFVSAESAWAYVDPGMGSYVFQLTIAGVLAGLYTVRRFSSTVMQSIKRLLPATRREAPSKPDGLD